MTCTVGCGYCGRCTEAWEREDELPESDDLNTDDQERADDEDDARELAAILGLQDEQFV
jgi:hypothetical protein